MMLITRSGYKINGIGTVSAEQRKDLLVVVCDCICERNAVDSTDTIDIKGLDCRGFFRSGDRKRADALSASDTTTGEDELLAVIEFEGTDGRANVLNIR